MSQQKSSGKTSKIVRREGLGWTMNEQLRMSAITLPGSNTSTIVDVSRSLLKLNDQLLIANCFSPRLRVSAVKNS
jgi:hypothetical protein